jgi:VCBS repeat-containing protein
VDWSFSIADKDLDFLSAGETLTITYNVTVADGSTSSTQTVTITATGAADPLVINAATADAFDLQFPDAGNVITTGELDLNTGGDASALATVTEVNGSAANVGTEVAGTYGVLVLNADGSYSYTANSALDALQVGDNPTDQFTFTATDNQSRSVTTTLTFNVTGTDDAPRITAADTLASLTEDAGPTIIANGGFESGDLTGWTTIKPAGVDDSHISVQFFGFGGEFENYSALLSSTSAGNESLVQAIATTPGQHYTLGFSVSGDSDSSSNFFSASWDGTQILAVSDGQSGGFTHYSFDVVGDASASSTLLQFTYNDDGTGLRLDNITLNAATAVGTETANGTISFADVETADTHTASFAPQDTGYFGTFSLSPITEAGGSGSLGWHFTVDNSAIQSLALGQTAVQTYTVTVTDDHGIATTQDVTVSINGTNDAPTAVNDTIISDAGPNGSFAIGSWALGANDTDPDTTDHHFASSIGTSTGGSAGVASGFVTFSDDATLGGSFTYNSSDGHTTSSNFATATVINNATSTTTLTGTGADEILVASNGSETLNGGGGNDILFGNGGSHVLTGGSGNDTFAFQSQPTGANVITDFNNTTAQDHIAVSANSFGGGLVAGQDVTSIFETSGDDQFSGSGAEFHFDTANQTLYYSADGTQTSAITLVQVQAGVTINPHDLLIV